MKRMAEAIHDVAALKTMTSPRKQLVEQINLIVSTLHGYSIVYTDIVNT